MPAHDETEARMLCERGEVDKAATWVLHTYGPEVMSYLISLEPVPDEARDVFSEFCVGLWEGLPRFRFECSLRTYCYVLARRQWALGLRRRGRRRAEVPLTAEAEAVVEQIRTSTAEYLRTDARERLRKLRETLDEKDHTLLVLRLHRQLEWPEIARVLSDDATRDDDIGRRA